MGQKCPLLLCTALLLLHSGIALRWCKHPKSSTDTTEELLGGALAQLQLAQADPASLPAPALSVRFTRQPPAAAQGCSALFNSCCIPLKSCSQIAAAFVLFSRDQSAEATQGSETVSGNLGAQRRGGRQPGMSHGLAVPAWPLPLSLRVVGLPKAVLFKKHE